MSLVITFKQFGYITYNKTIHSKSITLFFLRIAVVSNINLYRGE